jgi:hypothetical protein
VVTLGAGAAEPERTAEDMAVRAPPLAEVAGFAARTLVHGGGDQSALLVQRAPQRRQVEAGSLDGDRRPRMPQPEGVLPAGGGTIASAR